MVLIGTTEKQPQQILDTKFSLSDPSPSSAERRRLILVHISIIPEIWKNLTS